MRWPTRLLHIARLTATGGALALAVAGRPAYAGELDGSRASIRHQNLVAKDLDLEFARNASQVERLASEGRLERVSAGPDLVLSGVSYPYAQPEVHRFLQLLSTRYRAAVGAPLVVTSLTRPTASQPRNASPLSVHPAGMAVDLRIPADAAARAWLERALLDMERAGVLDVTRERRPPHLHVAIFPEQFVAYARVADSVAAVRKAADDAAAAEAARVAAAAREAAAREQATDPSPVPPLVMLAALLSMTVVTTTRLR